MENMFATKDDRRFVTQSTDLADTTIVILGIVLIQLEVYELLVMLTDAILVEAGQASLLVAETTTFVTTWVCLDATFIHFVHAIWQAANIRKRGLLAE